MLIVTSLVICNHLQSSIHIQILVCHVSNSIDLVSSDKLVECGVPIAQLLRDPYSQ